MSMDKFAYSEYVALRYEQGYYVFPHNIDITSEEISCIQNRIIIRPMISDNEDMIYVFTGSMQKENHITEFILYLEDENGYEFDASDNIKITLINSVDGNNEGTDILRRHYYFWKLGVQFDRGVTIDKSKSLILETNKQIGKFDIEIRNIDLFKKRTKDRRFGINKILKPKKVVKLSYKLEEEYKKKIDHKIRRSKSNIDEIDRNKIMATL